jgi:hypothetical protein
MGAVGYIDNVEVYNRTDCCTTDCCTSKFITFYLFVSDVPFISHDLNMTLNQPEVANYVHAFTSSGFKMFPLNHTGRYVRIQVFADVERSLRLAEVKVWGTPLPTNPKSAGQWNLVQPDLHNTPPDLPNFPPDLPPNTLSLVHISLLPSGKLLFWGRDKGPDTGANNIDDVDGGCDTYLWDLSKVDNQSTSQDDRLTLIRNNRTNLFCSGHSFLPNGNLFVAGGSEVPIEGTQKRHDLDGHGPLHTNIFDYENNTWSAGPDMKQRRWYPSVVTLSNGETLIVAGDYVSGFQDACLNPPCPDPHIPISLTNRDTEILERNQYWRWTPDGMQVELPNYPFAHIGPDGNVLVVSGTDQNGLSYIPSTNTWVPPGNLNLSNRHGQGTSVMFKGKIMAIGGRTGLTGVSRETEVINLHLPNPEWVAASPMHFKRYYATSVLMPDGQVFIVGGSRCGGRNNLRTPDLKCTNGAIMDPEIYNPETDSWSIMARQRIIRMYHSVALLLPDATILVAGGGRPGAYGEKGFLSYDKSLAHQEADIFYPPYLFNSDGTPATRPAITSVPPRVNPDRPPSINYGQSFSVGIGTVPASQIGEVVLVRLPSVTHTLNFDQRRVVLGKNVLDSQTLRVTAPANGNECPPGPYMLFVIGNGVPSVAKIIFVDAPACNAPPPPSDLVATAISNTKVNISWTASSGPVDHYEVYRTHNILVPFTKIADVAPPATSYTDQNVTGSVGYLYQVLVVISPGCPSQPSNMDLATTMSFTDNPLMAAVTVVKAQHINELRVAVNAVRETAGLSPAPWTDPSLPGVFVKAVHIDDLRRKLQHAFHEMGLPIPSFTDDPLIPGLIVKRVHVEEVRQAVR